MDDLTSDPGATAQEPNFAESSAFTMSHDGESPNYIMFLLTFAVIVFTILKVRTKLKQQQGHVPGGGGGRGRTLGRATPTSSSPPNSGRKRGTFYNGGVGAGGGGSSTMVEQPPDGDHDGNPTRNDTRELSRILGRTLLKSGSGTVKVDDVFSSTKLVGLYFSAHWCGPCQAFTPRLIKCYNAIRKRHGPDAFEIVFVSSDKSAAEFAKYFMTMPWLAVAFKEVSMRRTLTSKCGVRGIPSLIFLSPTTGKVLGKDGYQKVLQDASGSNFPWGVTDTHSNRPVFSGGGHSLTGNHERTQHRSEKGQSSPLSRQERAALIAARAEARQRKARANTSAKQRKNTSQTAYPLAFPAQATSASSKMESSESLEQPSTFKSSSVNSVEENKNKIKTSSSFSSSKICTLQILTRVDVDDDVKRFGLKVNNKQTTAVELCSIANKALLESPTKAFIFFFGVVGVRLTWEPKTKSLKVGFEGSAKVLDQSVTVASEVGGVVMHLSVESLCVSNSCFPWLSNPAGETEEGHAPLRAGRFTGGADVATPKWLRGEMEAPAGEQTVEGYTRGVFTAEQQARLGVDENGVPAEKTEKVSNGRPIMKWCTPPVLNEDDFVDPSELAEQEMTNGASTNATKSDDDYECPKGVRHIMEGMQELMQYLRDAAAHDLAVMVDYYATWCGPCRAIAPFYEELASMYAGQMVFLKVDCGGRQPGAINQDVKSAANISAFPTFHVYRAGEKVAEVRGGNRQELERLAAQYASGSSSASSSSQTKGKVLRSVLALYREELCMKKAVIAHGAAVSPLKVKPLSSQKAVKVVTKLRDLAEENIFPFEKPLNTDVIETLTNECLTKSLYWHTPSTSLHIAKHVVGVEEVTRALTHTVDPGCRPWWMLEHLYPVLDIAETILQHPHNRVLCASGKTNLYSAIVFTAERFCDRSDVHIWLESSIGRLSCERLINCLSLMASPSNLTQESLQSDAEKIGTDSGDASNTLTWLGVAFNGPLLVKIVARFVQLLDKAAGSDEEPCKVKNYERLWCSVARLLCNLSSLALRTPLRLKVSEEATVENLSLIINTAVKILLRLQTMTVTITKLPPAVIDGQLFALRAACTALVQANGGTPVHPESVSRNARTKSGLSCKQAQNVWMESRNKLLQRAITAVTKSANHLNRESEERKDLSEAENSKTPAQLLKSASRETVSLLMEPAVHPGQNTRALPNPWL
jgi:nucleoredoxin